MDNGPEFRSRYFRAWYDGKGIRLDFIEPGNPMQNTFIECFTHVSVTIVNGNLKLRTSGGRSTAGFANFPQPFRGGFMRRAEGAERPETER